MPASADVLKWSGAWRIGFLDDRELQIWKGGGLHDLPALHLWHRPAPTLVGSTSDRSNFSRGRTCSSGERCVHHLEDAGETCTEAS